MNRVSVNVNHAEVKWRKSLIQVGQLTADNDLLFEILRQLLERVLPEQRAFQQYARSLVTPVSSAFVLSEREQKALATMIPLSLIGQLINESQTPSEEHSISQAEWLLRDSPSLSIVGTAMILSLEECNGRGPLGLDGNSIPEISKAFRCLRSIAAWRCQHSDVVVVRSLIKREFSDYLDPETLTRLCQGICPNTDQDLLWLDVYQLRPGMQVMEDVRNSEGLLLIAQHTKLSQRLIDSLLAYASRQGFTQQFPILPPR